MPPSDDRYAPTIRASKEGERTPSLQHLNEELRKLYAYVQVLEGRLGTIKLRDVVSCPGLTVDSSLFPELAGQLAVKGDGVALFRATPSGFSRGCRVYNSVAIPTVDSVNKTLTFDSERDDADSMHNSANPSRITFMVPGTWLIGASVSFAASAVGYRAVALFITRDITSTRVDNVVTAAAPVVATRLHLITRWQALAGDYAEVLVNQNSGGPLDVEALSAYTPEFWVWQIG